MSGNLHHRVRASEHLGTIEQHDAVGEWPRRVGRGEILTRHFGIEWRKSQGASGIMLDNPLNARVTQTAVAIEQDERTTRWRRGGSLTRWMSK